MCCAEWHKLCVEVVMSEFSRLWQCGNGPKIMTGMNGYQSYLELLRFIMKLICSPNGLSNINLAHVRIVRGASMDCTSGMMVGRTLVGYLTLRGKLLDSKVLVIARAESTEIGPGSGVATLGKNNLKAEKLTS